MYSKGLLLVIDRHGSLLKKRGFPDPVSFWHVHTHIYQFNAIYAHRHVLKFKFQKHKYDLLISYVCNSVCPTEPTDKLYPTFKGYCVGAQNFLSQKNWGHLDRAISQPIRL